MGAIIAGMSPLLIALSLLAADPAACKRDSDCLITTWDCCQCPQESAMSKAQLAAAEQKCSTKKCLSPDDRPPMKKSGGRAVCKAGACEIETKPAGPLPKGAVCRVAEDCRVIYGVPPGTPDCGACGCCPSAYAVSVLKPPASVKSPRQSAPPTNSPPPQCSPCPEAGPRTAECLEGKCSIAPWAMQP